MFLLSVVVLKILSSLSQYQNFRSNVDTVRARMLEVMNHVDKVYFVSFDFLNVTIELC